MFSRQGSGPQGSVLGPLQFLWHINTLSRSIFNCSRLHREWIHIKGQQCFAWKWSSWTLWFLQTCFKNWKEDLWLKNSYWSAEALFTGRIGTKPSDTSTNFSSYRKSFSGYLRTSARSFSGARDPLMILLELLYVCPWTSKSSSASFTTAHRR